MSFSGKVNRLLKENKMTKAALAKAGGIPYTTLDSMLKRETDTEKLAIAFRIAKALGTSVEYLVFDEEEAPSVSAEEKRILELYSLLDSRGKDTVLSLLEKEADNSQTKKKSVLPLFESPAAAGEPVPVFSEEQTSLEYREGEIPRGTEFAIRIAGDSMEPLFFDGDLVYVEQTKEISSGEIGIFLLNGESLCKKFQRREGKTSLVSLNPRYEPISILESDDLRLVGKVIVS